MCHDVSPQYRVPFARVGRTEPGLLLQRAFPKLPQVIGEYEVTGKVVSGRVDLYCTEGEIPDGVVLIGDPFQNACPSTGLGLKKVFTDIAVLAECVPEWFSMPAITADKLRKFYSHPRKRSTDAFALWRARRSRSAATSLSPRWRLQRSLVHLKWNLERFKNFTLQIHDPRQNRNPQIGWHNYFLSWANALRRQGGVQRPRPATDSNRIG